jgi:uncharacterized protein
MKELMIENAERFARGIFANDFSGHDFSHTQRVAAMAKRLAREEGADEFIAVLAALLHDVDDAKLSPETSKDKLNARRFMADNGVDSDTAEKVVSIISNMSFSGSGASVPDSIEGKCVQDADRLDAIGAIGAARAFAYGGSHGRKMYDPALPPREKMTEEEYRFGESTTVNHFYEKLFKLKSLMNTDSARRIALGREAFMRSFLEELYAEWKGER